MGIALCCFPQVGLGPSKTQYYGRLLFFILLSAHDQDWRCWGQIHKLLIAIDIFSIHDLSEEVLGQICTFMHVLKCLHCSYMS